MNHKDSEDYPMGDKQVLFKYGKKHSLAQPTTFGIKQSISNSTATYN